MDYIRKYRNKVFIDFENRGENFTLKVPHFKKWLSLIALLRKRGFKVGLNPYYEKQYKCLSKFHKIGFKRDVAVLMTINPANIEIEFGNIINLWKDAVQSFWDNPRDDRYTPISYLQQKAVELEIDRVIKKCLSWGMEVKKGDNDYSNVDYILNKLNNNKHIHGEVNCLEDINRSIESGVGKHNQGSNSRDKNGKQIICGQKKYFYSYNRRLSCGEVWHNINNMWWVLCGSEIRNIASFELFDFEPELPRRNVPNHIIENALNKSLQKKDYLKCARIQASHKFLQPS